MEFLTTPLGFGIMIYLAIGCIIMKVMDNKYPNTLLIAWLLGATAWLPAVCYGLLKGFLKKRR